MFSIIIPVYNKEKYLNRTLNAVLKQTFQDYEVILIDDGSTDGSVAVIKPFLQDKRISLIHQKNAGVSAARNRGIEMASYNYIAFLDADDLWHPQYLEEHSNAWRKFPDVFIIGSRYQRIKENEHVDLQPKEPVEASAIENYFLNASRDLLFWTSSLSIKKEVFEKIGFFNTQYAAGEDIDIWIKVMFYFKGAFISGTFSFYLDSENQFDNAFNLPAFDRHLVKYALEDYKNLINQDKEHFNTFLYEFLMKSLMMYYFTKKYKQQAYILYRKIPFSFRIKTPLNLMFILPYSLAKKIFLLKTK
jgi:glycosyltransferase involved in cell wall biosynthesis